MHAYLLTKHTSTHMHILTQNYAKFMCVLLAQVSLTTKLMKNDNKKQLFLEVSLGHPVKICTFELLQGVSLWSVTVTSSLHLMETARISYHKELLSK